VSLTSFLNELQLHVYTTVGVRSAFLVKTQAGF